MIKVKKSILAIALFSISNFPALSMEGEERKFSLPSKPVKHPVNVLNSYDNLPNVKVDQKLIQTDEESALLITPHAPVLQPETKDEDREGEEDSTVNNNNNKKEEYVDLLSNCVHKNKNSKDYYIKAIILEEKGKKEKSIKNLKKAADKLHGAAAYLLGCKYLVGRDVPRSEQEGIKYLNIAKDSGSIEAEEYLRRILPLPQDHNNNHILLLPQDPHNPQNRWKYISEKSNLIQNISRPLKDWMDIGSTFLYLFGYEKYSKLLEKAALLTKTIYGVSQITYGTSEFLQTGKKSDLLPILCGTLSIGSAYIQYQSRDEYNNFLTEKEKLQIQIRDNTEKIDKLEQKRKELEKCSESNYENVDLAKCWEEVIKENNTCIHNLSLVKRKQQDCFLNIFGIECTDEVCIMTVKDVNEGRDFRTSIVKNIGKVIVKKLAHPIFKENKEVFRDYFKIALEATKERLKKVLIGDFQSTLDQNVEAYLPLGFGE